MAFSAEGLRVIGACHGFALWHYVTADRLSAVLAPGYFEPASGMLRAAHHLHVSARVTREGSAGVPGGAWRAAGEHALLAVTEARPGRVAIAPICQVADTAPAQLAPS